MYMLISCSALLAASGVFMRVTVTRNRRKRRSSGIRSRIDVLFSCRRGRHTAAGYWHHPADGDRIVVSERDDAAERRGQVLRRMVDQLHRRPLPQHLLALLGAALDRGSEHPRLTRPNQSLTRPIKLSIHLSDFVDSTYGRAEVGTGQCNRRM